MATLPTPLQKQLDEIEALYKPAETLTTAEGEGEQAPDPDTVEQPPVEPQQNEAASQAPAAPAPAPEPPAPTASQDDAAKWEHRFKTLQGMHNQNMADQKRRLEEANKQIADLKKTVVELQVERATPTVDPKDVETFGEDLLGMVNRVVDAKLGYANAKMDSRFDGLETQTTQVAKTVAGNAEAVFFDRLAAQVPDYETLNVEQGLLDWLAVVDPIYGEPRQAALDRAVQVLNANGAAAVFKAYKEYKATKEAAAAPPTKSPAQAQLEKQVSPRGSSSTTNAAPAKDRRVYRQSEVLKFYDDVTKGRYRGRHDEMQREEAAINAAIAEGRIA